MMDFEKNSLSCLNELLELGIIIPDSTSINSIFTLTQDGINFLNKMKSLNEVNLDDIFVMEENES
jgi:predicted transcriptional regulator